MSTLNLAVFYALVIAGAFTLGWCWARQASTCSPPTFPARNAAANRVLQRSLPVTDKSALGVFSPDVDGVMKKVEDDG